MIYGRGKKEDWWRGNKKGNASLRQQSLHGEEWRYEWRMSTGKSIFRLIGQLYLFIWTVLPSFHN
jgi:hypothetical protein